MDEKEMKKEEYLAYLNAPVKAKGYIAFIVGVIFFCGVMQNLPNWINWFDYINLLGKFGALSETAKNITGSGGTGARAGWMLALTIVPSCALATGVVNVIEGLDGLRGGMKILNPILKPLLGIPGWCGLAFIGHLFASTDTGAALTNDLVNNDLLNERELTIFACFQYSATGFIGQALSYSAFFMPGCIAAGIPLGYILIMGVIGKFIAGNLMRLYLAIFDRKKKEVAA